MCLIQMVFVLINSRCCELQALHYRLKRVGRSLDSAMCNAHGPNASVIIHRFHTDGSFQLLWPKTFDQLGCLQIIETTAAMSENCAPHSIHCEHRKCSPCSQDFPMQNHSFSHFLIFPMVFPRTKTGEKPRLHYQCVLGEHLLNHLKGSRKKGSQKTWSFVT